MSYIYRRVDAKEEAIIAYSAPGSQEFTLATIDKAKVVEKGESLDKYDYLIAPFDKSIHSRIGIHIASYATSMKFSCYPQGILPEDNTSIDEYKTSYAKAFASIEANELDKIVISRLKNIYCDVDNIYPLFLQLKNKYISSYTFLIHIPDWGTWMGSTPELLIQSNSYGYTSRAIAGTRQSHIRAIQWGDKELEEHRYIETYLRESLTKADIEHDIMPTFNLEAGPVTHICSDIRIKSSTSLDTVIDIIHPGPALSGMPRDRSVRRISEIEPHDRKYYCGYLGSITDLDSLELYVMIRCMEIYKNGYKLYVGGGITKDSELQKEWEETNHKADTLLSVLEDNELTNQ